MKKFLDDLPIFYLLFVFYLHALPLSLMLRIKFKIQPYTWIYSIISFIVGILFIVTLRYEFNADLDPNGGWVIAVLFVIVDFYFIYGTCTFGLGLYICVLIFTIKDFIKQHEEVSNGKITGV